MKNRKIRLNEKGKNLGGDVRPSDTGRHNCGKGDSQRKKKTQYPTKLTRTTQVGDPKFSPQ